MDVLVCWVEESILGIYEAAVTGETHLCIGVTWPSLASLYIT